MKFYILLFLNLIVFYSAAMKVDFDVNFAVESDIDNIANIIDKEAQKESKRLVILPKKFQKDILKKTITNNRLFVAKDISGKDNPIAGYKKLFILDGDEKEEVLRDEIRCVGQLPVCQANITQKSEFGESISRSKVKSDYCDTLAIYTGGDYTLPEFRGKGVNSKLIDFALKSLKPEILEKIKDKKIKFLSLVYGITKFNCGKVPGDKEDRSYHIAKAFIEFIKSLNAQVDNFSADNIVLNYKRYPSFMPTFDYNGQELKPLPDENSVPGYGCVLTYDLGKNNE